MIIKIKQFIDDAIKNGHDDNRCNGWDWIRQNLSELDFIFRTEEYKKQDGMKYKCMPFLYSEKDNISNNEKGVLETAWYLNNERTHAEKKENYEKKMLAEGWIKLTEEVIRQADKDKKKLLVNATGQNDWATIKIENIFKPLILVDNIMLQKPRMRTRGYYLSQFENAFCKIIN